jgi:hypothetical protein
MSDDPITDAERKMLALLRDADAVFVYRDDGCRTFSWIKGLSEVPARASVEFGYIDGRRVVRRLKINMGVSQKVFEKGVEAKEEGG